MNKTEFGYLMAAMNAAYPNEKITEDLKKTTLWFNMLRDMDYKTLAENLKRHIRTSKYAPTIAELRQEGPRGFNNFTGRNYDMDKLELALLGINPVKGIGEVKEE